jgi:ferredoxin-thioredoxin reductase catalytic chain
MVLESLSSTDSKKLKPKRLRIDFDNLQVAKVHLDFRMDLSNQEVVLIIGANCPLCRLNPMDKPTQASDKNLELMRSFSESYAKRTGTYFCVDPSVTAVVIEGLAKHKDDLGAPLCPCRHYEDKQAEAAAAYWNCPCVPMRERKECHCMLFLPADNDFAGTQQEIGFDEIRSVTNNP